MFCKTYSHLDEPLAPLAVGHGGGRLLAAEDLHGLYRFLGIVTHPL